MVSARDLRRRIRSIGSTAQITRAMQMVAASKMRRAQDAVTRTRPFAHLLYRIQRTATTQSLNFQHPLLEKREVHKRAVILVAGDKGLCGALNTNLFRVAAKYDTASTVFITAGKRAAQFVARSGRKLAAEFQYGDNPTFPEARAIATVARDMFLKREVDEVVLVVTRFINTLTQQAIALPFLPIGRLDDLKVEGMRSDEELARHSRDITFEPSASALLEFMLGRSLNIFLYQTLLNAKASEQSARMVSMKQATDNADALIKELKLQYNKMRQSGITTELLDIQGGQAG
jgi:F-type H+-transporting ATPase subunit gamma